ncbi:LSM domain-containing protein [Candidatus Nitrosarchaeum limnium]|jgi:small nuclear ribonucleoprotein|uniref:LSM domain protein n=1 Tax=Candidatus Nitrosarchaeum limnium BG20 TaxID=859192 RepID=S2EBI3_9ARCH|nr:LSM domain-containing protein [Candidatus Nitrosarchaeum limnium]EPA06706.1 LSM domain protein [Candidatus Nitrosarchaeum limnium BG20]
MGDEISNLMTNNKNKVILLRLRNNKSVRGSLQDFDIHMNLTLDNAEDISDNKVVPLGRILLRGDNILAVSLPDEES